VQKIAPAGNGDRVVAGVTLDNRQTATKPSRRLHTCMPWFVQAQVAFTEYEVWISNYLYQVRRATAAGGKLTVLPTAGPKGDFALGWGAN
jgi:hypothetical protein